MPTIRPSSHHCISSLETDPSVTDRAHFILADRRGIRDPQMWVWEPVSSLLYKFPIPVFFPVVKPDGSQTAELTDNPYFPLRSSWHGTTKAIRTLAQIAKRTNSEIADYLKHPDPVVRALVYKDMFELFGREVLDSNPKSLEEKDARTLINRMRRQIAAASGWKNEVA